MMDYLLQSQTVQACVIMTYMMCTIKVYVDIKRNQHLMFI